MINSIIMLSIRKDEIAMSENNNIEEIQHIKQALQALEEKYASIQDKVKKMDTNTANMEEISQKIQQMMDKLNTLSDKNKYVMSENMKKCAKKMIANPCRAFTVESIRFMLMAVDKSREGVENFRECMEDIIAEAQYEHKKRYMQSSK